MQIANAMDLQPSMIDTAGEALASSSQKSRLHDAAQQFEALMIGQTLKSAHEGESDGWMGTDADDADQSALGMAETQLAGFLAANGGFGLAKTIETSMDRQKE